MAFFMPTLNPASVDEYIHFGLYGFAMSRFSGCWVGFKAISETVESAASVDLDAIPAFEQPDDYQPPAYGLHYRWPDLPGPQVEARMVEKLDAVRAFARANPVDRRIFDIPDARFGIVTTGKGHLDLMEALRLLGIDERRAREIGIDVYKVGMVWPLETEGARAFLRGKEEVLVVEEKRGIIEGGLKEDLYDYQSDKPSRMVGKYDEEGNPLIPWTGELSPTLLAPVVAARITHEFPGIRFDEELAELASTRMEISVPTDVKRTPYFCAGCPHNTSTRVPKGSKALAGIGCHFMASWMDRNTESLIQMGGEGVNWVGKSRFCGNRHVFQNLGEVTYFHSGYMAVRQAVNVRRVGWRPFVAGLIEPGLVSIVAYQGLLWTTAVHAAVIFALMPLIASVFARVFLKEAIAVPVIVGALVGLGGVVLLVSGADANGDASLAGDLLIIVALFMICGVQLTFRRLAQEHGQTALVTAMMMSGATVTGAIALCTFGDLPPLESLNPPNVDLGSLSDLEGTLKLLRETEVLP